MDNDPAQTKVTRAITLGTDSLLPLIRWNLETQTHVPSAFDTYSSVKNFSFFSPTLIQKPQNNYFSG